MIYLETYHIISEKQIIHVIIRGASLWLFSYVIGHMQQTIAGSILALNQFMHAHCWQGKVCLISKPAESNCEGYIIQRIVSRVRFTIFQFMYEKSFTGAAKC